MSTAATSSAPNKAFVIALWIAQVLLFATFTMSGFMKLTAPIPELSAMMPWTGELSETFVRFIGLIDLAGGFGVLLPALTRIQPRLSVLAALGIIVLQVLAIFFHASRVEWSVLPLNLVLLSLAVFVFWGRYRKAPIETRW